MALAGGALVASLTLGAASSTFRSDDPLSREPETQDASGVKEWTIDLFVDLTTNMFGKPGDSATGVRAGNVNTIDEVPDSSWFTNRIGTRPISIDEAVNGAHSGRQPAPGKWTVIGAKEAGFAPGFTIQDSAGEVWFVSFDARDYPEAATAAILVANNIFWTLGYFQVDNVLTIVDPSQLVIGKDATVRPMSGATRQMRKGDLDDVWRRAHRSADGTYRAVAARRLPGRPLGGFRYYGTRPDDPNDIVPHEHRRELRALRVFGAWTNLVDMKAGNTLDVLITENGRGVVRHYLQDVGSTFGTGAMAPREYDEGWEHLYQGELLRKRLVLLGFPTPEWAKLPYVEKPAIGRFEGQGFDPAEWKPRVPTAAYRHAQADDLFWAARRVTAFSDEMIRALAKTGRYSDPESERLLADVLIQRRDKIAAAYLTAVNPLVNFQLSPDGVLSFEHAAAAARVGTAPAAGYELSWARFDNTTGAVAGIGESRVTPNQQAKSPGPLPDAVGSFVRIRVRTATPSSESEKVPVTVYFRRTVQGWSLVGLERTA
jgi:hypothetical protein